MGMSIDEAVIRYKNNAEYERTHGNLQDCLEFRQIAKWLEKLQKIQEIYLKWNRNYDIQTSSAWTEVVEVLEMGKIIDEYMDIKLQQKCVSKTIDTLWRMAQKYQKIEQLIAEYENEEWEHIAVYRIREIIDGNDSSKNNRDI